MKLFYTTSIIILFVIFPLTIFSQYSIVEQNGESKIVKVTTPNGVSMIIPSTVKNNSGTISDKKDNPVQTDLSPFIWTLKFTAPGKVFKDVSFANTQVGYIVTELGSVYKTTNGGDNWVLGLNLGFPYYWYGVHALTIDTVVIAGFNNQDSTRRGALRWSFNGGSTWTSDIVLQRPANGVGWLDRVHFYNQNTGIVFNSWSGACYYTTTGGKNAGSWTFVQINPDISWFAGNYDFQNSGIIYGAGIHIGKSTNFGVNWTSGPPADQVFDGGIDFLDQNNQFGWTGGGTISPTDSGWTHQTTNGGSTWSPRQMNFNYPIRVVKFFNQNTGFAVGGNVFSDSGGIYSTSNGGTNWNLDVNTSAEMFSLEYKAISADSMDVWCCGSTGGSTGFTGKLYKARLQNLVSIHQISSEVPANYKLNQNYPNPFNPKTVIGYQVAANSFVKISVFDITGKFVEYLVNQNQNAGVYNVDFDGANLSSGIYFYCIAILSDKLSVNGFSDVKKMVLIK
jgi:photosystem II stability/assembly factor-like uncharacterized protein